MPPGRSPVALALAQPRPGDTRTTGRIGGPGKQAHHTMGIAPAGHRNRHKTGRHPPGTRRTADTSPPDLYTPGQAHPATSQPADADPRATRHPRRTRRYARDCQPVGMPFQPPGIGDQVVRAGSRITVCDRPWSGSRTQEIAVTRGGQGSASRMIVRRLPNWVMARAGPGWGNAGAVRGGQVPGSARASLTIPLGDQRGWTAGWVTYR
jgi:hypothetical protein